MATAAAGSRARSSSRAEMSDGMGRFGGTAAWVLVALQEGPLGVVSLLDRVRQLDGHVRPGTFYGAVVRLDRYEVIEPTNDHGGGRAYRLRVGRSGGIPTRAE